MDMSFSCRDATPLAPPALGYPALLAAIREAGSVADTVSPACGGSPVTWLADVLLGRPGWREASLALGGSFADPMRKPV